VGGGQRENKEEGGGRCPVTIFTRRREELTVTREVSGLAAVTSSEDLTGALCSRFSEDPENVQISNQNIF
jgi:hypothetical protein